MRGSDHSDAQLPPWDVTSMGFLAPLPPGPGGDIPDLASDHSAADVPCQQGKGTTQDRP